MERKMIYLGSFERAVRFVYSATESDARILLVSGSSTINGKSLLGVFTLNLAEPITLEIHGDKRSKEDAIHTLSSYIQP